MSTSRDVTSCPHKIKVSSQHIKPSFKCNYRYRGIINRQVLIYGVEGESYADRFVVEFPNQYGCLITTRLTHLVPPGGKMPPARFIRLALNREARQLDVTQIFGLILVQVALNGQINALVHKKRVEAFANVALEGSAFVPRVSHSRIVAECDRNARER
jgi:hypothetical protein